MYYSGMSDILTKVALLAEGVDRNFPAARFFGVRDVALLAEGVDRNSFVMSTVAFGLVALLAEGVDRNSVVAHTADGAARRPPRGGRG